MTNTKNIGFKGEAYAAQYLENKGYSIIAQNWFYNHKELDLVARIGKEIVFVEVKTRMQGSLVSAIEAVNLKKQRFIIEAANAYILKHNLNFDARFDIVTVINTFDGTEIEHIENAFYPRVK
jgi:putative endonuclease